MHDQARSPRAVFRLALESDLRRFAAVRKACAYFVSEVRQYLGADSGWLHGLTPGPYEGAEIVDGQPRRCDEATIRAFAERRHPELSRDQLLAPLRVNDRLWGVVGLERDGREFDLGTGRTLTRLCAVLAQDLARREDERLNRVLDRIKEKVFFELRPRDLAYQILDGLEQLADYDHSAALLTYDAEAARFRVEADRIVWTKAKSRMIGQEMPAPTAVIEALRQPAGVRLLDSSATNNGTEVERGLFELLDYYTGNGIPAVTQMLCAPLYVDSELLGLLKVAAWKRRPFDAYDVSIVERFLPAVAVALRNMRLRVTLEDQAIQAESRAGLVTLARAVAHDVNNAIGGILPLAEQAREDLDNGSVDPACLREDLDVIIEKARLCKRIFSNMLRVGTEQTQRTAIDLNHTIRELIPVLEAQAAPRQVPLEFDLGKDLPAVRFSQAYLERLLWNLVNNAIEALRGIGGQVHIRTRKERDKGVLLAVRDNGPGIDAATLERVEEPFFTTKSGGTGLGLSICRSLVWQYGGRMRIRSRPGEGTEVQVTLPSAAKQAAR